MARILVVDDEPAVTRTVAALHYDVCVLTGAGVSAESGVPTFREAQTGLWARYDPLELATPEAFARDPELVWRWYRWRRELVARAEPNPAHRALAELQSLVPRLTLVTQNVDGMHQRAGSADVIEFHGNLFSNRCFADGRLVEDAVQADRLRDGDGLERLLLCRSRLRRCARIGLARPRDTGGTERSKVR